MKRKKYLAAGALLLFLTVLPAGASAGTVPLTILNKSMSSEEPLLSFDLWNTSDKAITAWRLSLAYDDGFAKSKRSVLDQDFALTVASRGEIEPASVGNRIERPILPGEVASSQWSLELPEQRAQTAALSLRVAAVVFEDGSYAGDPEVSRAILAGRSARLEEMKNTIGFLRRARAAGQRGGSAKQSLAARARELREESQDPALSDGLRREVAAQLSAAKMEGAELLESLEASLTVEVGRGDGEVLDAAIAGLEEQVLAGEGRADRGLAAEDSAEASWAPKGVQR